MVKQNVLKVLVSEDIRTSGQGAIQHSDLWSMIDKVRLSQDPSLDVKLQPHQSTDDVTTCKSGEAEAILVLVGLATFAARPILRFIVDLAKILCVDRPREIGARRRSKLRVKTQTDEIEIESEDIDEQLHSLVTHVINQRLVADSQLSTPQEVQEADIEFIITNVEDLSDESS